ncbi:retropepsin-like aspartic protease family protein [Sodalinema gerasimenkoae]|uniref:retropepsin-like aspartic protease family protein n=1 Tax=Sodalinema gerasimenkoae TaxID=2862348 RepID=UPI0013581608|nr:retropepsin-like aspartic protease [Sodalinema gerasimenkoae]
MKRTVLLSIAAIAVFGLPERALSQEFEGCFFIDGHGQLINLDNLCPRPSNGENADSSAPTNVVPGERSRAASLVEVPIQRRVAGIPVVEVMFNGRRSYEMLVDTGASGTVITAQMARELNITSAGTATIDTASERGVQMDIGYVSSMEINGIALRNTPVTIGSEALQLGLLGQDFLRGYDVTIRENSLEFARRN